MWPVSLGLLMVLVGVQCIHHHQQEHCHDQTPEGEGGLRVSINFKFLGTPPKLLTFSPTLTNATAFLKKYKKDAETSVTIF